MKVKKMIKYAGLVVVLLSSCRDKVELDELKTLQKQLVVEGIFSTDLDENLTFYHLKPFELKDYSYSRFLFKISQTSLFYSEEAPKTQDATITVTNKETGKTCTLISVKPGVYVEGKHNMTKPLAGEQYEVKVEAEDGKIVTAQFKVPKRIEIESCTFEKYKVTNMNVGGDESSSSKVRYKVELNTPKLKNKEYVRVNYMTNGTEGATRMLDYQLFRGGENSLSSTSKIKLDWVKIKTGEEITINLYSISEEAYEYYRTLNSITVSASIVKGLANPKTNWSDASVMGAMIANNPSYITYKAKEEGDFEKVDK